MPYLPAKISNRIQETSLTTGTGVFTLQGALVNFRSFSSAFSDGDLIYYSIISQNGSEWETGIGTFNTPNQLTRTTVQESSNANALVNFSGGIKLVVQSPTASWAEDIVSASINNSLALSIAFSG